MVDPQGLDEVDVLTRTVYGEARGESEDGQAAVAWVIRNRAAKGLSYMGTTIKEVCLKPFQFSCWNKTDVNRSVLVNLNTNDRDYQNIRRVVEEVLAGRRRDNTYGSTHYHAKNATYDQRSWADRKTPVVTIGAHLFYNNID